MSRILMVDDANLFQMLETTFVRRLGCEIVRATDGGDVVAKAIARAPDLIVIDAERPGVDGAACVRALKGDPALRDIPVLVVTSPSGVQRLSAAGADATLTRPVAQGALELALSSLGHVSHRLTRRRSVRLPVQVASAEGTLRGRVKDISRSGLFLAVAKPLPLHAPVSLALRLPGPEGERPVRTRGVVVRQVADDPESDLIPGVGVRFVEMDAATKSIIDFYVDGED